jgi:hypothetical protein
MHLLLFAVTFKGLGRTPVHAEKGQVNVLRNLSGHLKVSVSRFSFVPQKEYLAGKARIETAGDTRH